eukprot:GHVR01066815.1.p1 GENE.GHVR01066815.1~~GHVR01066815.1.p1  ORF type:complete len:422 (+),score=56.21 GHVR01066815.1:238-1503(+)
MIMMRASTGNEWNWQIILLQGVIQIAGETLSCVIFTYAPPTSYMLKKFYKIFPKYKKDMQRRRSTIRTVYTPSGRLAVERVVLEDSKVIFEPNEEGQNEGQKEEQKQEQKQDPSTDNPISTEKRGSTTRASVGNASTTRMWEENAKKSLPEVPVVSSTSGVGHGETDRGSVFIDDAPRITRRVSEKQEQPVINRDTHEGKTGNCENKAKRVVFDPAISRGWTIESVAQKAKVENVEETGHAREITLKKNSFNKNSPDEGLPGKYPIDIEEEDCSQLRKTLCESVAIHSSPVPQEELLEFAVEPENAANCTDDEKKVHFESIPEPYFRQRRANVASPTYKTAQVEVGPNFNATLQLIRDAAVHTAYMSKWNQRPATHIFLVVLCSCHIVAFIYMHVFEYLCLQKGEINTFFGPCSKPIRLFF